MFFMELRMALKGMRSMNANCLNSSSNLVKFYTSAPSILIKDPSKFLIPSTKLYFKKSLRPLNCKLNGESTDPSNRVNSSNPVKILIPEYSLTENLKSILAALSWEQRHGYSDVKGQKERFSCHVKSKFPELIPYLDAGLHQTSWSKYSDQFQTYSQLSHFGRVKLVCDAISFLRNVIPVYVARSQPSITNSISTSNHTVKNSKPKNEDDAPSALPSARRLFESKEKFENIRRMNSEYENGESVKTESLSRKKESEKESIMSKSKASNPVNSFDRIEKNDNNLHVFIESRRETSNSFIAREKHSEEEEEGEGEEDFVWIKEKIESKMNFSQKIDYLKMKKRIKNTNDMESRENSNELLMRERETKTNFVKVVKEEDDEEKEKKLFRKKVSIGKIGTLKMEGEKGKEKEKTKESEKEKERESVQIIQSLDNLSDPKRKINPKSNSKSKEDFISNSQLAYNISINTTAMESNAMNEEDAMMNASSFPSFEYAKDGIKEINSSDSKIDLNDVKGKEDKNMFSVVNEKNDKEMEVEVDVEGAISIEINPSLSPSPSPTPSPPPPSSPSSSSSPVAAAAVETKVETVTSSSLASSLASSSSLPSLSLPSLSPSSSPSLSSSFSQSLPTSYDSPSIFDSHAQSPSISIEPHLKSQSNQLFIPPSQLTPLVSPTNPIGLAEPLPYQDMEQGSEEWHKLRKSKLTASAFSKVIGFWPGERMKLWKEKVGLASPFAGNEATKWGVEQEKGAVELYRKLTNNSVSHLAFKIYKEGDDVHSWLGASPDGLIESDHLNVGRGGGILEVKCPFNKGYPRKANPYAAVHTYYMPQAQGLLEIFDRDWLDFYVWTVNGSVVFRVYRDPQYWELVLRVLSEFWWCNVVPAKHALREGVEPNSLAGYRPEDQHGLSKRIFEESAKLSEESFAVLREVKGKVTRIFN